ncbi:MAG: hypothetical protein VX833_03105 [Actinomycetota bacterium]|nr:hypothetical protein [Actinomycetota bacterium]
MTRWLERQAGRRDYLAILILGLGGLLTEISYTRIVSYKLFYYYTYLVIGLALLGLGCGGVLLAVSTRLRRLPGVRLLGTCGLVGAITMVGGYFVVSTLPVDTAAIWEYGTTASLLNLCSLVVLCIALFVPFVAIGISISFLLSSQTRRIGRLYAADLLGASLACLIAVPLQASLGPPRAVMLAALLLTLVGIMYQSRDRRGRVAGTAILVFTILTLTVPGLMPEIRTERVKSMSGIELEHSEWGPVFRVDVQTELFGRRLLYHDALLGSNILSFDGNFSELAYLEKDPRAIPFQVLGSPPGNTLIVGAAGGHEILASLYFGATTIDAVELNPVTTSLLEGRYASYSGDLVDQPGVSLTTADGRTHLTRSDADFDLIWFVAPDSYAAGNAASSGAFVLSESYLYTVEMLREALNHLTDHGIIVAQFGEYDFEEKPNRTARYVSTAYAALRESGVDDPSRHLMVSTSSDYPAQLSTIILKGKPFDGNEVDRLTTHAMSTPDSTIRYTPKQKTLNATIGLVASTAHNQLDDELADYPYNLSPVRDDAPFFWHFQDFGDVLTGLFNPVDPGRDPEVAVGERVLVLLLLISIALATVFLLLPFALVRRHWSGLPRRGSSFGYFAALGIGFMFFEVTMIQRLVLLLGYPTYSLTVTLASLLVFAGLGSLASSRLEGRPRLRFWLFAVLTVVTAGYLTGLTPLTNLLIGTPAALRFVAAFILLAPLGFCLGIFMPLGLRAVARLSEHRTVYVAWAWAVNGFFSVVGSVLTTILAMAYGFRITQLLGLAVYLGAILLLPRLSVRSGSDTQFASS